MVTTLYAGILGLIYIVLSAYVIKGRFKHGVSLGDGGNDEMSKRIRAHANFIEYVPLALILIILAEFEGTSEVIIHGLCLALLLSRLAHPLGLIRVVGPSVGRSGGMITTFSVILIAALFCIKSFFIF